MGKQAVTVLCDSGCGGQVGTVAVRTGNPHLGMPSFPKPPNVAAAGQRDPVRL